MYSILEILAKNYKVDLVTYSLGREFNLDNVNVYRTTKYFKPNLPIGKPTISKIILDSFMWVIAVRLSVVNKYDVIHCEDFEGIGIGAATSWLNSQSKYVYDLHNRILDNLYLKSGPKKLRDIIISKLERLYIKKSDLIILNWGKYLKDEVFEGKNMFLYYDPLTLEVEEADPVKGDYLIYSGNFEEYQGLQNFIPAFCKINANVKLLLVGEASDKIKQLIIDLHAENKVILTGRLSVEKTNFLIKNSVMGILPRIKGSSMKVVHYFMSGKPVIATNTSSNRELIKDGINGYLYTSDKGLEEKLNNILANVGDVSKGLSIGVEETKEYISGIWNENNFIEQYGK